MQNGTTLFQRSVRPLCHYINSDTWCCSVCVERTHFQILHFFQIPGLHTKRSQDGTYEALQSLMTPLRRSSCAKDKPFRCTEEGCNSSFFDKSSLRRHEVTKHGHKKKLPKRNQNDPQGQLEEQESPLGQSSVQGPQLSTNPRLQAAGFAPCPDEGDSPELMDSENMDRPTT